MFLTLRPRGGLVPLPSSLVTASRATYANSFSTASNPVVVRYRSLVRFPRVQPAKPPSERRRRPRARAAFAVVLATADEVLTATASDVSELGLAVRCKQKLPMRTQLRVELALAGAKGKDPIQGHVIRCTPVDATGREHHIAIAFTDVPPLVRAAIYAFVRQGLPAR